MILPIPPNDLDYFRRCRQTFYVSAKGAPRQHWQRLGEFSDLGDAYDYATRHAAEHFEVGLFWEHSRAGGFLYWTSRRPDGFNAPVALQLSSTPRVVVRCFFTRNEPTEAGAACGAPVARRVAETLARVAKVLSVRECGPYWKIPALDEVVVDLEREGNDACERVCKALAQGGWQTVGDNAVWNTGPGAHAADERLVWANVMLL